MKNKSAIICISVILSLIILSVFVLFYEYCGIHIKNKSRETDYKWMPYQFHANAHEGFSYLRADREGFNNITVPDKTDILIMGSSHMEAYNVGKNENTGALLSERFKKLKVYNIGISEHRIYNSVYNLKYAYKKYKPEFIIVETSIAELDINSMKNIINGKYKILPSYDSGILFHIRSIIPCSANLFNQLSIWMSLDKNKFISGKSNNNADEKKKTDDSYKTVLNEFLLYAKKSVPDNVKIIIIYHPKTEIDRKGNYVSTANEEYAKVFRSISEKNNIDFIDLSYEFENYYNKNRKLPHGFVNTKLGVGHLNRYGHKIFADVLEKELGKYVSE